MRKEVKICLPIYKILYSAAFVVILSFVRGIVRVNEIGAAMESPIALLSMIFCADTYLIEIQNKREDVFKLYSLEKRTTVIFRRLAVQIGYLTGISVIGYGFFYWQKPITELDRISSVVDFGMFLMAILGTILFWGMLSMTISNIFRNVWAGIGSTLFMWLGLVSQAGNRFFGKWNIFSFTFRDIDKINDWSWIYGKTVSLLWVLIMMVAIPFVLKKRG